MIIWNLKKLEEKLAKNEVTELEAVNYTILNIAFWTLMTYLPYEVKYNWQLWSSIGITIAILYFGMKKCYKINSSADSSNFLIRLFPLYFVLTLKVFAYL